MPAPPKPRKIVVLGAPAVGKSSLTIRFVEDKFVDNYYPTIESSYTKVVKHKNQEYALEINDTAGQDEFSILNNKHSIGTHGYAIVYSITSRDSFNLCETIRDKILNYTGTDWVPIVLIGNKCDLESQRQVSKEELAALGQKWDCSYVESSAFSNINITKAFDSLIGEIEKLDRASGGESNAGTCIIQ